jgi:hypothetical protein
MVLFYLKQHYQEMFKEKIIFQSAVSAIEVSPNVK